MVSCKKASKLEVFNLSKVILPIFYMGNFEEVYVKIKAALIK